MRHEIPITITIAVADPETAYRAGVRCALAGGRFDVVAEGATIEAIAAGGSEADVVLLDEMLFLEARRRGTLPPFRHIGVLVQRPTLAGLKTAVAHGALGYIPRDVPGERFASMVDDLAAGVGVIPSFLSLILLAGGVDTVTRPDGTPVALTLRQAQIHRLAQDGMRTQEIADVLDLSPVTVRRHLSDLQAKMRRRTGTTAEAERGEPRCATG